MAKQTKRQRMNLEPTAPGSDELGWAGGSTEQEMRRGGISGSFEVGPPPSSLPDVGPNEEFGRGEEVRGPKRKFKPERESEYRPKARGKKLEK